MLNKCKDREYEVKINDKPMRRTIRRKLNSNRSKYKPLTEKRYVK